MLYGRTQAEKDGLQAAGVLVKSLVRDWVRSSSFEPSDQVKEAFVAARAICTQADYNLLYELIVDKLLGTQNWRLSDCEVFAVASDGRRVQIEPWPTLVSAVHSSTTMAI